MVDALTDSEVVNLRDAFKLYGASSLSDTISFNKLGPALKTFCGKKYDDDMLKSLKEIFGDKVTFLQLKKLLHLGKSTRSTANLYRIQRANFD